MSDGPALPATGTRQQQHQKRTRVLLSCAPCRNSKLKCDRGTPCTQCAKKARPMDCVYAPRPNRDRDRVGRPPKSVAARLRRLEGMVREMLDGEGDSTPSGPELAELRMRDLGVGAGPGPQAVPEGRKSASEAPVAESQVVRGENATTWVGATHFMAMLDDIEDLKAYFDEPEEPEEQLHEEEETDGRPGLRDSPEMLMMGKSSPRSRQDLLDLLPPRNVVDRLVMRFFASNAPAQQCVHRPTFVRQYNAFWQDQSAASLEWLSLLFMLMCLGIFFSSFSAPHELDSDQPQVPPMQRFKVYRAAASWALVASKYSSPGPATLLPFMLYVESEFLINRQSQMNCYLLLGVLIRLMLKMGLHRDPSKLVGIAPYEGEIRRRLWNLAIQIDLIVSFHLGLPSMILGIDTDTEFARNLADEDFDEDSVELPPARPETTYTQMSYPIWKSVLCRVFGQVARLAHLLSIPSYDEVMRVDALLAEKWAAVPKFLMMRSLEDSVADPPSLVVHRFGLASLYQKSRIVLHRRYLAGAGPPRPEHEYSRRVCLEAALEMLGYQRTLYASTRPGGMLSPASWFVSSLAQHDFLLAAMMVYLVVQNPYYDDNGAVGGQGWVSHGAALPDKNGLVEYLRRSGQVWRAVSQDVPELKRAADMLRLILDKVCIARGGGPATGSLNMELEDDLSPQTEYLASESRRQAQGQMQQQQQGQQSQRQRQQRQQPPLDSPFSASGISLHAPFVAQGGSLDTTPLSNMSLSSNTISNSGTVPVGMFDPDRSAEPTTVAGHPSSTFPTAAAPAAATATMGLEQMPFSRRDLVPDPSQQTTSNTFDTSWIPMNSESLDWSIVDEALRTNSQMEPGIVDDWLGTTEPLTADHADFMFWVNNNSNQSQF